MNTRFMFCALVVIGIVVAARPAGTRAQDYSQTPPPVVQQDPAPSQGSPTPTTDAPSGPAIQPPEQWTVTTPHGTMTQTRERTATDDGYSIRRQQVWTNADGTPLRSHEFNYAETDPRNFQRDSTITLRDGRTIEHSYSQSWDGSALKIERTFTGPNGQTWTREQTRTATADGTQVGDQTGTTTTDQATQTPSPIKRHGGFTIGSSSRAWRSHGLGKQQPDSPDASPGVARRARAEVGRRHTGQGLDHTPHQHGPANHGPNR